jgi:putative FmdB family regulatory protein
LPTYEYQCKACKAVYELRQGFDAETTHTCEECGKGIAKRVLHAPPVVFKGGGWYATDSRNTKTAVTDSDSASSTSADGAASSDSKSEKPKKSAESKPSAEAKAATTESAAGA